MILYLADSNYTSINLVNGFHKSRHEPYNLLISYWYFRNPREMQRSVGCLTAPEDRLFGDSGAFSAHTMGSHVDIHEYGDWLFQYKPHFTVYASLDVLTSVVATRRNQRILEDKGLLPLPTFHRGEPYEVLREYCEEYDYVAIGGMAAEKVAQRANWSFLVKCFEIGLETKTRFHGFGMTTWKFLRDLPWYSVDSSTWSSSIRYGRITLFDPVAGKFVTANLGDVEMCKRNAHLFRSIGMNWQDFAQRNRNTRRRNSVASVASYVQAAKWLGLRHRNVWTDDLGPVHKRKLAK